MIDAIKIEQNRLISLAQGIPLQNNSKTILQNRVPVGTWLDWESLLQIWPLIRPRLITIAGVTDVYRLAEFKGVLRAGSRSTCSSWSHLLYGDWEAAIGLMNSERAFCSALRHIISDQYIRGWTVKIGDTSTTFHKNDVGMLLSYISTSVIDDYYISPIFDYEGSVKITRFNKESDAETYGIAVELDDDLDALSSPSPKRTAITGGNVTFELDDATKKKLGKHS